MKTLYDLFNNDITVVIVEDPITKERMQMILRYPYYTWCLRSNNEKHWADLVNYKPTIMFELNHWVVIAPIIGAKEVAEYATKWQTNDW